MNQLLSCAGDFFAVALKDQAYLVESQSCSLSELKRSTTPQQGQPKPTEGEEPKTTSEQTEEPNQKTEEELREIHAVAIATSGEAVWCAVARGDKTLSIYKREKGSDVLEPCLVYATPKRLSCLCFTHFPKEESMAPLVIAGDLGGDAYAYNVENKRHRLLLGHTASMLTSICVHRERIMTADRDEKIRVSAFPHTYEIESFLLGHSAYITGMAAAGDQFLATCSGDQTIRLWNMDKLTQDAKVNVSGTEESESNNLQLLPTDLTVNPNGTLAAVIFDGSDRLDIYRISSSAAGEGQLKLLQSVTCASQPLAVSFHNDNVLFVLLRDSHYMAAYQVQDNAATLTKVDAVEAIRSKGVESKVQMPVTILEKDKHGQPKLQKIQENRGPAAADAPWNRVERIDIAKERGRRHKRRKAEEAREKSVET